MKAIDTKAQYSDNEIDVANKVVQILLLRSEPQGAGPRFIH